MEWVHWSYIGVGEGTVTVQVFLRYKSGAVFQIYMYSLLVSCQFYFLDYFTFPVI